MGVTTQATAQNKSWSGSTNANWHNPNNWDPYGVPGSNANVTITPNNGNPYPVISEQNASVASIQISNYNAGQLTVSNNKTLTISNGLNISSGGTLFIESGGAIDLTGGPFTMAYNNSEIALTDGAFTSEVDVTVKGNGFNAVNGTVTINGQLTIPNSKSFNTGTATVTIANTTEINGTYNGDNGLTTFNNNVQVRSGGTINMDVGETGTIIFNESAQIRNNGTLNLGSGTANLNAGLTAESDGNINVQDGNLNVQGDATFQNNGNLSVDNGNVNVTGDASLQNGGSFNFNNGSLSVGGNSTFQNGGKVNAGNSQIDLKGDLTVQNGGDFNADSSTVSFSGQDQQINTNGNNISFYNVKVDSGSSVSTDGSAANTVTITNDLTVEENGQVNVQGDDNIDIQGNLENQGGVESQDPFVYAITTPSLTEVVVTYDQPMNASTSNVGNYKITFGDNNTRVNISSTSMNTDSTVTLTTSSTLNENTTYILEIVQERNVTSQNGNRPISENHIKQFNAMVNVTFYSRTSGSWGNPNSWSTQSHTGAVASSIPNAQAGEKAVIGNSHTITVNSTQNISVMDTMTVDASSIFRIASGGTLILEQFAIGGAGTFELQAGGTIRVGSPDGITGGTTARGNIQTTGARNYSSSANYTYAGPNPQKTGSGLPQEVQDLRINNPAGVTASNNLRVNGTLYLQNGTLTITSSQGLIANTKSIQNGDLIFQRILSGNPGWRMISSPVATTYDGFLSGILTQGYNGAQYDASASPNDTLQPNVLYYDESYQGTDNQRWRAPSSANASVPAGLGHNLYIFGDVSNDNRYNNALPDTISVQGEEHSSAGNQIDLNITYTAQADTGWNLVGNPYGATINWDNDGGWTKTNIDQTIYIWDPDTQSYKTWNGSTGSLGDGLIPPFQAFWVKANANNPQLSVSEDAKTFGGNFVGKIATNKNPEIEITLKHEDERSSIFFSFYRDAKVGKDPLDAYYLQPPPGVTNYSEIYSIGRSNNQFNINALPLNFGVPIEIPIDARVLKNNRTVSKIVNLQISEIINLPPSWEVTLVDRQTGKTLSPTQGRNYQFSTEGSNQYPQKKTKGNVLESNYHILGDAQPSEARFALRIKPGTSSTGLPNKIALKANYPNPFNPKTNIRFTLPIQHNVTLEIYNILGRKVATLLNDKSYQAGLHSVSWDASNVASGTYIYRLITDERIISKKMTVIK